LGEVGHAGLAIELRVGQGLEPMGHCRQQRAQNAWTFLLELRPKVGLKLTLLFRDRCKGLNDATVREIGPRRNIIDVRPDRELVNNLGRRLADA
jgi:hypothetical protein